MDILRVMFDTNILVKFTFIYYKEEKNVQVPRSLKKFIFLLNRFEQSMFRNVMSKWNIFELRDVLMKLKLEEIYLMNGYTVREFGDAKSEIALDQDDMEGVNLIIDGFIINSEFINITKDMNLDKVDRWTKKGFSVMDIILLHQAELNNCDYFITHDKRLYLNEDLKKNFNVKICSIKEFKEIIK
ncbi:hypothetical protein CMI37_12720 [Candidatus Pacearchaeota archaeon]|nr:hypothetical protein [Candidatus Pacearchaeota archaeon]|tara:strand:- start:237 stop:791 length:555 start_codon:yes stop_codon:yes gene_type:complete